MNITDEMIAARNEYEAIMDKADEARDEAADLDRKAIKYLERKKNDLGLTCDCFMEHINCNGHSG